MPRSPWIYCAVFLTLLASTAAAQQPQPSRNSFAVPAVGTPLPEVTVFDHQGNRFSTEQLRDHYSVLVFGCLT